jgi:hypothetical protein
LAELNTIVAQREDLHRKLTAMTNDGGFTVLTFESGPIPVTNKAVIAPQKNGKTVLPDGASLVCTGTIFVDGQLTPCSASRMP